MRGSAHFGRPACSALPGGRPQFAGLREVLALLQQLLPDVARHQGVAVLIPPHAESAGTPNKHWNIGSCSDPARPLNPTPPQPISRSTYALARQRGCRQPAKPKRPSAASSSNSTGLGTPKITGPSVVLRLINMRLNAAKELFNTWH